MLILLSGLMIGSTLFAVPKKRETNLTNSRSPYDMGLMMYKWFLAQPTKETEREYYNRMNEEALRCVSFRGRYDRLMLFERTVNFPLKRRVSKTFLSLLKYYLLDDCANAKACATGLLPCC